MLKNLVEHIVMFSVTISIVSANKLCVFAWVMHCSISGTIPPLVNSARVISRVSPMNT